VSYPPTLVPPAGVVEQAFGIVGVQARMRVMGVDTGLTRCGLSVVESGRGRQIVALDVDVVRTPADESLPKRLMAINDAVEYWLDVHRPQ
jgi:crossover junction endodeoxyribonuclease RuvC